MDPKTCAAAQLPIRTKGQMSCPHHLGIEVTQVCHTCSELVCFKCVKTVHIGHDFDDLEEFVKPKRTMMKKYLSREVEEDLSKLKQEIRMLQKDLNINSKYFDDKDIKITEAAENVQNIRDKPTTHFQRRHFIHIQETNVMKAHLEEKQRICSDLEKNIMKCKEALQCGSNYIIHDVDILPYIPHVKRGNPGFAVYIKQQTNVTKQNSGDQNIESSKDHDNPIDLTGDKTISNDENTTSDSTENHDLGTSMIKRTDQRSVEACESMQVCVINEFEAPETKFVIYDITSAPYNTAWVCCINSKFVTQFDSIGTVMEELEFAGCVNCVSVSPTTGNLWTGFSRSIYETTKSGVIFKFHVDNLQKCICVLRSENIAVGMLKEVSIFTADGERIISTKVNNIPSRISECPITNNISVLVVDSVKVASSSIVIMNKRLVRLRFFSLKNTGKYKIMATSVSYDLEGNLVVEAMLLRGCQYNVTLLLDGNGHYLRTLAKDKSMGGCKRPVSSISRNGILWRAYHDTPGSPQNIRLLKYSTLRSEQILSK